VRRGWLIGLGVAGVLVMALPRAAAADPSPTYVYFDQNEEEDVYQTGQAPYSSLATQQLVPPWDPNGQMCLLPDGSGRFTVGYNPTGVEQKNNAGSAPNGGVLKPRKQPPVGVALYNRDGSFSGQDLFVPGPYKLTPASSQWTKYGVVGPDAGGDIPPDTNNGPFNSEGTFTGCAVGKNGNLFAVDLGTAQGSYPPPDNGRLLEWFADSNYHGVCIVYGPDKGGNVWPDGNTHHVDGSGGLQQPGTMTADSQGNIYVPVDAVDTTTGFLPAGKVLRFAADKLPATAADCPTKTPGAANGDQTNYHVVAPTTFIDAAAAGMPFPAGIAWDPKCSCWAVDNVFFGLNAVEWFDTSGSPMGQQAHAPIPTNFGTQFSPFGMAFDPQGDLFVVDIHVAVDPAGSVTSQSFQAGPVNGQGRLLEFTFSGPIANPPTTIASGEDFPVAVTTCDPARQNCPGTSAAAVAAANAPATPAPAAVGSLPNTAPGSGSAAAVAAGAMVGAIAVRRRRHRKR